MQNYLKTDKTLQEGTKKYSNYSILYVRPFDNDKVDIFFGSKATPKAGDCWSMGATALRELAADLNKIADFLDDNQESE